MLAFTQNPKLKRSMSLKSRPFDPPNGSTSNIKSRVLWTTVIFIYDHGSWSGTGAPKRGTSFKSMRPFGTSTWLWLGTHQLWSPPLVKFQLQPLLMPRRPQLSLNRLPSWMNAIKASRCAQPVNAPQLSWSWPKTSLFGWWLARTKPSANTLFLEGLVPVSGCLLLIVLSLVCHLHALMVTNAWSNWMRLRLLKRPRGTRLCLCTSCCSERKRRNTLPHTGCRSWRWRGRHRLRPVKMALRLPSRTLWPFGACGIPEVKLIELMNASPPRTSFPNAWDLNYPRKLPWQCFATGSSGLGKTSRSSAPTWSPPAASHFKRTSLWSWLRMLSSGCAATHVSIAVFWWLSRTELTSFNSTFASKALLLTNTKRLVMGDLLYVFWLAASCVALRLEHQFWMMV